MGRLTQVNELPDNWPQKRDQMARVLGALPAGLRDLLRLLVNLFVAIAANYKVNKMAVKVSA